MNESNFDWKKYTIAFFITTSVFILALWTSNQIYGKQIEEMKSIISQISLNTSASEVQYNLLLETSCERASDIDPIKDLDRFASMLSQTEAQRGSDSADVLELKKQYTLLQIKDFLLTKRLADRCKSDANYILYFYSSENSCEDCKKQGWVLTDLRSAYPELRIYAFDYDMDFQPIKTLQTMYKLSGNNLPILIIDGKPVYGFKTREEIENTMPLLIDIKKQHEEEAKKAAEEAKKAEQQSLKDAKTGTTKTAPATNGTTTKTSSN